MLNGMKRTQMMVFKLPGHIKELTGHITVISKDFCKCLILLEWSGRSYIIGVFLNYLFSTGNTYEYTYISDQYDQYDQASNINGGSGHIKKSSM